MHQSINLYKENNHIFGSILRLEVAKCMFKVFHQIRRTNSNFSLSLMNVLESTSSRKEFTPESTWGSKTGILIEKGAVSKKLLKEKKEGFGQVRDL